MARSDWFRNETWDAAIERDFFARLARSRSQRDQYLVIQALTIAATFPDVALRLVEQYFSEKRSDFDDVRALSARAKAHIARGESEKALAAMKEVLAVERRRPGHKTTMYLEYPFFVARAALKSEYPAALAVLAERSGDVMFPVDAFLWNAAKSIIHADIGDIDQARRHATEALAAAKVENSGLRHHQNVGLVGGGYQDVIGRLRAMFPGGLH